MTLTGYALYYFLGGIPVANEEQLLKQILAEIDAISGEMRKGFAGMREGFNRAHTGLDGINQGLDGINNGLDSIRAEMAAMHEGRQQRRQEMIDELRAINKRI